MSEHSLNDLARFWFAVSCHTELVDDPKGLDHPLLDQCRRFGITLNQLCDFCRYVNETRAKNADQGAEQGGVGGALDLQSLNALNQGLVHQQNLQGNSIDLAKVNMTAGEIMALERGGVEP